MGRKKQTTLTPKQARFTERYIATSNARQSAIDAGYSPNNAGKTAANLLKNHPAVKAEIEKHGKEAIESGKYSYDRAMADAQKCFEFAEATGNANAMVRAAEHMSKLNGLLIDRHDIRAAVGFQINILGIDTPSPATLQLDKEEETT